MFSRQSHSFTASYKSFSLPNPVMSCLFFRFFLVCLAMHACNARHLGLVMDHHNVSSKEYVFSTQVVESVKQVNKKTSVSLHESGEEVSVSDKGSDDRSGFFSDYSTPRTRPPSHN